MQASLTRRTLERAAHVGGALLCVIGLALAYRLVTVAADAMLALAGFAMLRGAPARESGQAPP